MKINGRKESSVGKNILFITESYKISPSPNGNCVEKLAKELIGSGDKIIVLTLKNQEIKEKNVLLMEYGFIE